MQYGLTFLILAAACLVVSVAAWDNLGWVAVVPLYPALSFTLLAVAYAGVGTRLLFKKASGRRSVLGWLLLAPYFLLNGILFSLYRLLSREPANEQVAPNLFFGRRLSAREHQACDWVSVLDLAVEFPATWVARKLPGYKSLPVLDATSPTLEELKLATAWMTEAVVRGPVYVHCALGHGRSACVIIAYLLAIGAVNTVAEGVQRLRSLRSGVRLNSSQLLTLKQFQTKTGA